MGPGAHVIGLLLSPVLLTGCGSASTAPSAVPGAPAPAPSTPSVPAAGPTASPPAASGRPTTPSKTPYGVQDVSWPETLTGARALLRKMPRTLAGQDRRLHVDPRDRESASVTYGKTDSVTVSQEQVTEDTADGKPELFSANNQLAAMFGLVYGCAKGSFAGTAPRPSFPGGGPGVTDKPLTKDVWFSCTIDVAEGDEEFSGESVGWTSTKTAWLVVTKDKRSAQALVAALRGAAGSR